jgi:hypothetical protein
MVAICRRSPLSSLIGHDDFAFVGGMGPANPDETLVTNSLMRIESVFA